MVLFFFFCIRGKAKILLTGGSKFPDDVATKFHKLKKKFLTAMRLNFWQFSDFLDIRDTSALDGRSLESPN